MQMTCNMLLLLAFMVRLDHAVCCGHQRKSWLCLPPDSLTYLLPLHNVVGAAAEELDSLLTSRWKRIVANCKWLAKSLCAAH